MIDKHHSLSMLTILFILTVPAQGFTREHQNSARVHVDIIGDQRGVLARFEAGSRWVDTERSYIIARQDERYRIRISNRSNRRVGIVIAVDGRNSISGKKSYLKSHERMYILGPHQSQEYEGWRTGRNHINRFYFTGMSDSYAAHWGDQTAMGVVAVAVFNERHQQTGKAKIQGKQFGMQREAAGTGFGEDEWSPSREVHFAAQKTAARKTFIKYEWRKTLCRMGIVQCRPHHPLRGPNHNRFWPDDRSRHSSNDGFAPFPVRFLLPGF